jgi:hypothetical protein
MTQIKTLTALAAARPLAAAALAAAALVVIVLAGRRIRRVLAGRQAEDVLTMVAATVATTVVMNGMWRFAGKVLHFSGPERVTMFAFLELAMLTEAFRARRNVRDSAARAEHAQASGAPAEPVSAGVDGAAVWVLAMLSGMLSSLDAATAAEAVARLTAPLVAAWLWERGLSLYRRKVTGRAIHWRFTAERVLVRLGLAEPAGRTTSEVAAQRHLTRLALAAKHARALRASGARAWRQHRASRRLDTAMARAVEHASLATDPGRQDSLLAQMGALYGASALAELSPAIPWRERPALTPPPYAARTDTRTEPPSPGASRTVGSVQVDRAALVRELARDILREQAAGSDWRPDYDALMARTGYRRSWCEKAVRDARARVGHDPHAQPGTDAAA